MAAPDLRQATDWGRGFITPNGQTGLGDVTAGQPSLEVTVAELSLGKTIRHPELATVLLTRRVLTRTIAGGGGHSGRLLARIKYGVGAANDEVLLDWNYGTSIALPISPDSKINVNAWQIDALPPGNGQGTTDPSIPETWALTAMIMRGARASVEPPTLTYTVDVAAAGTTKIFVPNRAKRVIVQPQNGSSSTLTVQLATHNTSSLFEENVAADSAIRTTGVVLGGNVFQINLAGAGVANPGVQVIFVLDG